MPSCFLAPSSHSPCTLPALYSLLVANIISVLILILSLLFNLLLLIGTRIRLSMSIGIKGEG